MQPISSADCVLTSQDCLERQPEARPTAKQAFIRIKASNLRTQSTETDGPPLPALQPGSDPRPLRVGRLTDLQARHPACPLARV